MNVRHTITSRNGLGLAFALLALPALAGCPSTHTTPSPPPPSPVAAYSPGFAVTLSPIPVDIPSDAPACPDTAPIPVHDETGYYSACSSTSGSLEPELDIYNLSDGVLDVTPTYEPEFNVINKLATPAVSNPSPDGLPDSDTLVEATQDEVVATAQSNEASRYPQLVPVGGSIRLTSPTGTNAVVTVDVAVSEDSYAAQLLSSYVIDNLLEENEDSVLAYSNSIAECVNDATSLWVELGKDQDNTQIAATIDGALKTEKSCQELQEKLSADPDEAAHALAGGKKLEEETPDDLGSVLDKSANRGWISDLIDGAEDIEHHIPER